MARFWLKTGFAAAFATSAGMAVAQSPAPVALRDGTPPKTAVAIPDVPAEVPAPVRPVGYQPDPTPSAPVQEPTVAPSSGSSTADTKAASVGGGGGATSGLAVSDNPTARTANASDTGDLLSKSAESAGVEVQKRNQIVADPRIRGYRSGQYYTAADGGLFVPARADIDTPISKYDPGSIGNVVIVRGPYSALYGPTFAVLDLATLDSPRAKDGCGTEWHVRSVSGYQTNGKRNDGLLSVGAAGPDWGFRGTYNFLQGNDYRAGDGTNIPSSYLSNNASAALGFDLSPDLSFELKALKVVQNGLEFPGLYFDADSMDTEAYSARLTARHFGPFEKATTDFWYNATVGNGSTRQGAKQAFVQRLLAVSFNPNLIQNPNGIPLATFSDQSTSRFASRSIGYRMTGLIGEESGANLKVGHDLSVVGQGLAERIVLTQTGGPPQFGAAGPLVQNTGIPDSNVVNPGVFAQGTVPVTERWKLTAGGRVDAAFASSNPRLITGNFDVFGPQQAPNGLQTLTVDPFQYSADQTNRELSRKYLLLSGFLSSEFKVDEYVTASASVGHAERPPTLTELYANGPFIGVLQQGTSRLIGDPNLTPEKVTQFDVGLRADYGWLKAGTSGFFAYVHDYITFDANKASTSGGLAQVVYTNTDLATLAGIEGHLQANLTGWLTSFGTLSYVQGIDQTHADRRRPANIQSSRRNNPAARDFAADTEPLPQIPPFESRVGFRIHEDAETPKWQIEVSARMVAGQHSVATSLGELRTPGFTTFDVRGFWQAREWLLLTAGVENIGDRLYREHLDPIAGNVIGGVPFYRPGTNFFFSSQFTY